MSRCDLCSQPLNADTRAFSPADVRTAVKAGLRPAGAMADMAAALGLSKAEMETGWVQQVMNDSSTWSVCGPCAARIDGYLGRAGARGAAALDLPEGLAVASVWQRLGTFLIDLTIAVALGGGLTALLLEAGALPAAAYPGDRRPVEAIQNAFSLVLVLYWLLTEALFGRTLGKLVTGTRVVALDGSRIGWGPAALRTLSRLVPFEGLSYSKGLMWHDRWTKTRVVRAR